LAATLSIVPRPPRPADSETAVRALSARIAELEPVVAALRERGVVFEDYDLPGLKTEQGIVAAGDSKGAWFKDPDGNIVAIESTVAP
jgi:hypothetical protein